MLIGILLGLGFLILASFAAGGLLGAPWVPTFTNDVEAILDDARLKKNELFIELGCGDGRMLTAAAKRSAQVVGYELNPVLYLIARWHTRRYKNARVRLGNFWRQDLSSADVVITFLVPRSMARLEAKTTKELKPGARLVSYVFLLPKKKPTLKHRHWYVYDF